MQLKTIRRFLGDRRGFAAAEFGLLLPILIIVLMGCFEASRYILLRQKLDRASSSVADLVAQNDGVSLSVLNEVYQAALQQTLPFDLGGEGRVIVSSIYRVDDTENPKVRWQCQGGGALAGQSSAVGAEGADADLPTYFPVGVAENVIVAEVLYDYSPFVFKGIFAPKIFRATTLTRPRQTLLITDPGCP